MKKTKERFANCLEKLDRLTFKLDNAIDGISDIESCIQRLNRLTNDDVIKISTQFCIDEIIPAAQTKMCELSCIMERQSILAHDELDGIASNDED